VEDSLRWSGRQVAGLQIGILLANFSQGLYTVCMAWAAFQIGGTVGSIGLVFIWWSLFSLVLGPLLGVIPDRMDRRIVYAAARAVEAATLLAVAGLIATSQASLLILILAACLGSIAGLIANPCLQAFIKASAASGQLSSRTAGAMAVTQIGMVLGAGLGGIFIAELGLSASYAVCATAVALSALAILANKPPVPRQAAQAASYWATLAGGFRHMHGDFALVILAISVAAVFSVGQITNAILPAYVRLNLDRDAWAYGVLDALWSAGAITGSVLYTRLKAWDVEKAADRAMLFLLAAILFLFWAIPNLVVAATLQLALGLGFAICRIRFDSCILERVPHELIGRVRSNVQSLIGASGILIYLMPTIAKVRAPDLVYLWFSIGLATVALILLGLRNSYGARAPLPAQTPLPPPGHFVPGVEAGEGGAGGAG
jgi:MFS family permease